MTEHFPYKPHCVVLELTLQCNFKCIHCGGTAGDARSHELTLAEIKTLAKDLKKIGATNISVIGGEPFVRKDWFEAVSILKAEGLGIIYITNGYLTAEKNALVDKILSTEPIAIGLSLDGASPQLHDKIRNKPGSFNRVLKSIQVFQREKVNLSVITAVSRLNIQELPGIRKLLLNQDVGWQIQIANKTGKRFKPEWFVTQEEYAHVAAFIKESVDTYAPEVLPVVAADDIGYFSRTYSNYDMRAYQWDGCKAGIYVLGIRSNGDVIGCDSLPDEYIEGNIRERSLADIWFDPNAFSYTRHFNTSMLKGFCQECDYKYFCKGGCTDIACATSGHAFENKYCLYKIEALAKRRKSRF